MDINDLKMQRADLLVEAREMLDGAKTQADMTKHDKKMVEIRKLDAKIDALQKELDEEVEGEKRERGITGKSKPVLPGESREYRDMFSGVPMNKGGFEDMDEFLTVVSSSRYDPRLEELRQMVEGVGHLGGYAVPSEFGAFLMDRSLEREIVRPRATVWPMEAPSRKVPSWDNFDHTDGLFGGFVGEWLAEDSTATRTHGKLRQLELTLKKLACYTQISRELQQGGVDFEDQLLKALVETIGWYLDRAFFTGTGAGQPLGVLNDPALVTVPAEPGQAADTILYENMTKMYARLHPSCVDRAVWVANQTTLPQMMQMSIAVGVGGSFIPAVTQMGTSFSLLGKPLLFTEKVPTMGNQGDLILADFSRYAVGQHPQMLLDQSNAPGWLNDLADYRAIIRVDGQGMWPEPVTPANGESLSWAVTLEERS